MRFKSMLLALICAMAIALPITLLILILSSCTVDNTTDSNESKKTIKLFLYMNGTGRKDILKAVDRYNSHSNNIKIEHQDFMPNQVDEYLQKLSIGLMSGEGPDIPIIEKGMINSLSMVLKSGIFYDINKLIAKDNEFRLSDYNKKVLDSGIYQGKRYLMPIGYKYLALMVEKGKLENNNIKLDEQRWTWTFLSNITEKFMKENKDKYMFFCSSNLLFDELVQSIGYSFIDIDKKHSKFNTPEFIETLNMFKEKIYPGILPDEVIMSDPRNVSKALFHEASLYFGTSKFPDSFKTKYEFYSMPTYSGENSVFLDPCYSVAITNKCKYKEEAFEFIKILLSEEIQNQSMYIPVNKNAYESSAYVYFENIGTGKYYDSANDSSENEKRKQKVSAQAKVIEEIGQCEIFDYAVFVIINKELPNFLNGNKTAEQTANIINDKVNLYLNE